jgi:hypothetical protein
MEQKTQSNSKKVLYLITKSNFGGAQKYVYELDCEAQKKGFDVSVAMGGNGILIQKLGEAGITTYPLKSLRRDIGIFSEIKSFFEICSLLRKVRPDILHVNSSKAGGTGALAGRICYITNIGSLCYPYLALTSISTGGKYYWAKDFRSKTGS